MHIDYVCCCIIGYWAAMTLDWAYSDPHAAWRDLSIWHVSGEFWLMIHVAVVRLKVLKMEEINS